MGLTRAQHDVLLLPIRPHRVGKKDGQSHVEAYEIRAHLIRVFGPAGWSGEVIDMSLMYEAPCEIGNDKRPGYEVGYRCTYRLTIHATGAVYVESAFGGQKMGIKSRGDCHDFAIKTAESQALKRAATNLGDQFGLGLYNKGSMMALVGTTVVVPDAPSAAPQPGDRDAKDPSAHITEQLAPENTLVPEAEPPAATPPGQGDTDAVTDIRTRALAATKKAELMRLLMEVGKHGLGGAQTTDADGNGVFLEGLINARLKAVA